MAVNFPVRSKVSGEVTVEHGGWHLSLSLCCLMFLGGAVRQEPFRSPLGLLQPHYHHLSLQKLCLTASIWQWQCVHCDNDWQGRSALWVEGDRTTDEENHCTSWRGKREKYMMRWQCPGWMDISKRTFSGKERKAWLHLYRVLKVLTCPCPPSTSISHSLIPITTAQDFVLTLL